MNRQPANKEWGNWAGGYSRLVFTLHDAWHLIWAQRKVVGRQLPWGSAAVLAVAAAIILDQSDQPGQHFQLVCELLLPLAGAVSTAYLFSPENDPPLELLYTCPRSVAALLGARLVWLAGMMVLPVGIVQMIFLAVQTLLQPHNLWLLVQAWAPPTICLSGLGLLIAQGLRSAQAGVLVGVVVWILQVLMPGRILVENQVLSLYLFPVFAGLPMDQMALNRWVLSGLGLLFFAAGFALARDPQRHWSM